MKGWRDKCIKTGFDTFQGFLGSLWHVVSSKVTKEEKKWRCIYYSLDWITLMISQRRWEMPFLKQEWITKKYCQIFGNTVGHNIWSFLYHDVKWIRSRNGCAISTKMCYLNAYHISYIRDIILFCSDLFTKHSQLYKKYNINILVFRNELWMKNLLPKYISISNQD